MKVRTILTIKKFIGRGEVEISLPKGSTLDDLLSSMIRTYGEELSSRWIHPDGQGPMGRSRVARIVINGRDIEFLNGLETGLQEGDEVLILPVVSGG